MRFATVGLLLSALSASVMGSVVPLTPEVKRSADATKYVFAHFIVGIVASYEQSDWENDMNIAKSIGIDAFALNIGKDDYNDRQLGFAYAAADATGFKVFISFDFAYWGGGDVGLMSQYLQNYATKSGQFKYADKAFVSSFVGDGFNFRDAESQSGVSIFACPNWQPGSLINNANADCGMAWNAAWPNTNNQPLNANISTALDNEYINDLGGKPYMMPVSPWFSTHYGPDTYSKNWIFYSDWLYQTRWEEVLQLQPQFVEILTWNDFGESHYIGPLHPDDTSVYAGGPTGAIKWVDGMTHDAWRDVAQVYISAYKAGAGSPSVQNDELVYYYRPNPKGASCSDPVGKPDGFDFDGDNVFAIAMVKEASTVVIQSGSNGPVSVDVPAGITTVSAPMGVGAQTFTLNRGGSAVFSDQGQKQITSDCSVNNFNAFVGKLPA